jgi:hypothetical protein
MGPLGIDSVKVCLGGLLATVGLTGCVPGAYVSDYPGSRYYGSGYGYSSAAPLGYSGQPGYYGRAYYTPPVVYYGHVHDRRDCRHERHRERWPRDEHDRRDRDRDGHHRIDERDPRSPTRREEFVR